MRGSKFPADMHNYVWCPIYIPSFMIIGSVVSEELRWQDFGTDGRTGGRTDGRTDGRSDCTPRPAFAFGDAGKNWSETFILKIKHYKFSIHFHAKSTWQRLNIDVLKAWLRNFDIRLSLDSAWNQYHSIKHFKNVFNLIKIHRFQTSFSTIIWLKFIGF